MNWLAPAFSRRIGRYLIKRGYDVLALRTPSGRISKRDLLINGHRCGMRAGTYYVGKWAKSYQAWIGWKERYDFILIEINRHTLVLPVSWFIGNGMKSRRMVTIPVFKQGRTYKYNWYDHKNKFELLATKQHPWSPKPVRPIDGSAQMTQVSMENLAGSVIRAAFEDMFIHDIRSDVFIERYTGTPGKDSDFDSWADDAEDWMYDTTNCGPGSLNWCCIVLDIDAMMLRDLLEQMREDETLDRKKIIKLMKIRFQKYGKRE